MKKSLLLLAAAASVAFAPAAFAAEPEARQPAVAEFRAPAPQAVRPADLARTHATAATADHARAAGQASSYRIMIIVAVLVAVAVVASA